ncbi:MAG TPA: HutD family protein [Aliidongia sp.]|nr:HutD family protein [Aliidongia sp.]
MSPTPASPSVTQLPAATYRVMPWRNGLGTTTEIAIEPGAGDRFRWRVSIADVPSSGPFSNFPGYDRLIAVVSGAGMRLAVDKRATVLLDQASAPYGFPGDAPTECTLVGGPIRDFNLILDRASTVGSLARLRFPVPSALPSLDGGTALLHALAGRLTVDAGALGTWMVAEGDTLRLDGVTDVPMIAGEADGEALLATIKPRDGTGSDPA